MTERQLHICLRKINVRRHNEYAIRASLHGLKVPLVGAEVQSNGEVKFDEKTEKALNRARENAMYRIRERYKNRGK